MKKTIRIATTVAALLGAGLAQAADVTVKVDGVKDNQGSVRIMLFDAGTWLRAPLRDESAAAGATTVTMKDVAPGDYVFVVYQDTNGNGRLDVDAQGVPQEMFALSNEPSIVDAPPSFEEAKFTQTDKGTQASVKLISMR